MTNYEELKLGIHTTRLRDENVGSVRKHVMGNLKLKNDKKWQ